MIEFLCLQCCDCKTFQCQQRRKDKKFTCKMCGKKQSVVKVYGISYKGKDIRGLVMKYNEMRGKGELIDQEQAQQLPPAAAADDGDFVDEYDYVDPQDEAQRSAQEGPAVSKWAQFLDNDNDDKENPHGKDDDDDDDDDVVQAFLMKRQRLQEKRARRRKTPYQKPLPSKGKTLAAEKRDAPIPSNNFPKLNLNRFKEHTKVVPPPVPPVKNDKNNYDSDDDDEEAGTKKIVVDPNSKWAAFL